MALPGTAATSSGIKPLEASPLPLRPASHPSARAPAGKRSPPVDQADDPRPARNGKALIALSAAVGLFHLETASRALGRHATARCKNGAIGVGHRDGTPHRAFITSWRGPTDNAIRAKKKEPSRLASGAGSWPFIGRWAAAFSNTPTGERKQDLQWHIPRQGGRRGSRRNRPPARSNSRHQAAASNTPNTRPGTSIETPIMRSVRPQWCGSANLRGPPWPSCVLRDKNEERMNELAICTRPMSAKPCLAPDTSGCSAAWRLAIRL